MTHIYEIMLIYSVILIYLLMKNKDSKSFFTIFRKTVTTKNIFLCYLAYSFIIFSLFLLFIYKYNNDDKNSNLIIILFLIFLFFPLTTNILNEKINIRYNIKNSQSFKSDMINVSQFPINMTAMNRLTHIPFYDIDDVNLSNEIGKMYSVSEIINNKQDNHIYVIQTVTFVFKDGSLTTRFTFSNDIDHIYPPDGLYFGHIISGSGDYESLSGKIKINVKGDDRKVDILLE